MTNTEITRRYRYTSAFTQNAEYPAAIDALSAAFGIFPYMSEDFGSLPTLYADGGFNDGLPDTEHSVSDIKRLSRTAAGARVARDGRTYAANELPKPHAAGKMPAQAAFAPEAQTKTRTSAGSAGDTLSQGRARQLPFPSPYAGSFFAGANGVTDADTRAGTSAKTSVYPAAMTAKAFPYGMQGAAQVDSRAAQTFGYTETDTDSPAAYAARQENTAQRQSQSDADSEMNMQEGFAAAVSVYPAALTAMTVAASASQAFAETFGTEKDSFPLNDAGTEIGRGFDDTNFLPNSGAEKTSAREAMTARAPAAAAAPFTGPWQGKRGNIGGTEPSASAYAGTSAYPTAPDAADLREFLADFIAEVGAALASSADVIYR